MSRLSRYVSNVTGSSAYWYKVREDLDPVYTVSDPHGHDIKLDSFKTSVAFKDIII